MTYFTPYNTYNLYPDNPNLLDILNWIQSEESVKNITVSVAYTTLNKKLGRDLDFSKNIFSNASVTTRVIETC